MKVGNVVEMEQLRQMAVQETGKLKKSAPVKVAVNGAGGQAVEVNIGSGLEKTAMLNAIYK